MKVTSNLERTTALPPMEMIVVTMSRMLTDEKAGSMEQHEVTPPLNKEPKTILKMIGRKMISRTDQNTGQKSTLTTLLVQSETPRGTTTGVSTAETEAVAMESVILLPERQATMPEVALLGQ